MAQALPNSQEMEPQEINALSLLPPEQREQEIGQETEQNQEIKKATQEQEQDNDQDEQPDAQKGLELTAPPTLQPHTNDCSNTPTSDSSSKCTRHVFQ